MSNVTDPNRTSAKPTKVRSLTPRPAPAKAKKLTMAKRGPRSRRRGR